METTRPSSGLHLLEHTPNITFSSPFSGMKNPHVEHGLPSDAFVDSDLGPRGPSYHRLAVCERPRWDSTCLLERSNSSTASSTSSSEIVDGAESSVSSTSGFLSAPSEDGSVPADPSAVSRASPSTVPSAFSCAGSVLRNPSSMRGSSGSVPMESVTARSVGSRRSFHGIHCGGRRARSVGTKDDSLTVQRSNSMSWYKVTDHCQPSYPRIWVSKRKSVTLSPKSMDSTKSPT